MMNISIRVNNLQKPFKEFSEKKIFLSRLSKSMEDFSDRRFQGLVLREALEVHFKLK